MSCPEVVDLDGEVRPRRREEGRTGGYGEGRTGGYGEGRTGGYGEGRIGGCGRGP
ncbi:hypothetical protein ACFY0N_34880 [Streptomyces vinaceus]|uniref:hypothetical protein n=1 Tax=Streptomyces vinaceus TaxID=1960 RepID=UPI003699F08F